MTCLVISSQLPTSANLARRRCSYDVIPRQSSPGMIRRLTKRKQSGSTCASDKVVRIQSVGNISCEPEDDPDIFCLIQQASLGLQRYPPELAYEGDGGTYYLHNIVGELLGVFKPSDEDPQSQNNPKKKQRKERHDNRRRSSNCEEYCDSPRSCSSSRSSVGSSPAVRQSIPRGQTAKREVAAYALDRKAAGVPPTMLVRIQGWELSRGRTLPSGLSRGAHVRDGFCYSPAPQPREYSRDEKSRSSEQREEMKVGSLQQFIKNECGSCDRAPQKYSVEDVHNIGILDLRIFNTDRHGGNMLVSRKEVPSEDGICYSLVPIDHGYSFPVNLSEANFEWMYWPQARVPFSAHHVRFVEEIDLEEDEKILRKCEIEEEAICVNRIATMLLKEGVKCGLTLNQIARLCCRQSDCVSELENVVASVVLSYELPALDDRNAWCMLHQRISELVAKTAASGS